VLPLAGRELVRRCPILVAHAGSCHLLDTKLAMVVGLGALRGAIMAHVVFWLVALIAAALTGPMGFTVVIAAWIGFKRPLRTLARQFVEHAPFAS
jgi:hypothetical protein